VKPPPRQPIKTYVPLDLRQRLRQYAAKKGVSESAVNHAALERYLEEGTHEPSVLRKLERIERNQERHWRDLDLFAEAFAVFVQIWFAHTPRLPESDRPLAQDSALRRFREYAEHVGDKMADGERFLAVLAREGGTDVDQAAASEAPRPPSEAAR
jgi:hypothetical protein